MRLIHSHRKMADGNLGGCCRIAPVPTWDTPERPPFIWRRSVICRAPFAPAWASARFASLPRRPYRVLATMINGPVNVSSARHPNRLR